MSPRPSFSVIEAVVLNPLPFRDPQQLVHVWEGFRGGRYHRGDDAYFISVRPGTFYDWRAQSQSFSDMSAYHWRDLIFTRGGQSQLLSAHEVVEHFFETLGTPALLGRTLGASDYAPDAPRLAVLGNRLWVNRFGQERVRAGLRNAKAKGRKLGRPRVAVDATQITQLRAEGRSWREIGRQLRVAVATARAACQGRSNS